jgi:hypothetical protein
VGLLGWRHYQLGNLDLRRKSKQKSDVALHGTGTVPELAGEDARATNCVSGSSIDRGEGGTIKLPEMAN